MQVILRPIHARNRMVSHDELVIIYNENIFKRCLFLPNSGNSFQESMFAFEGTQRKEKNNNTKTLSFFSYQN